MTKANWSKARRHAERVDWKEAARRARLVKAENNVIDRKKLDEWLTREITRTKTLSGEASDRKCTEDFWFYKGKIEALATIRLQLRENHDILGLLGEL
jgi:hypothetical protein